MFEHRHQPMITRARFRQRLLLSFMASLSIILAWLFLGMLGYHFLANLPWTDAYLNASMIVSGMGPIDDLNGKPAKIFAGTYALISGVVILSTAAILFAPLAHRLLHHFHRPQHVNNHHTLPDDDGECPG